MKLGLIAVALTPGRLAAQVAAVVASRTAIERMQEPGVEAEALGRRAGSWDVVMTLRPAPDAAPVVTTDLVAERSMVGLFLQEIMKPAPGSKLRDFRRISYLTYNRVEGRWQYVSLDTRFSAGIMPAWSYERERDRTLILQFEALGFVGFGPQVERKADAVELRDHPGRRRPRAGATILDTGRRQWAGMAGRRVRLSTPALKERISTSGPGGRHEAIRARA